MSCEVSMRPIQTPSCGSHSSALAISSTAGGSPQPSPHSHADVDIEKQYIEEPNVIRVSGKCCPFPNLQIVYWTIIFLIEYDIAVSHLWRTHHVIWHGHHDRSLRPPSLMIPTWTEKTPQPMKMRAPTLKSGLPCPIRTTPPCQPQHFEHGLSDWFGQLWFQA